MDKTTRDAALKAALNKAANLHHIYQSREYQQTLLPVLEQLAKVPQLNPEDYPTREEFMRICDITFAKCRAYADLLKLMAAQEASMNKMRQELEKPERNYSH